MKEIELLIVGKMLLRIRVLQGMYYLSHQT